MKIEIALRAIKAALHLVVALIAGYIDATGATELWGLSTGIEYSDITGIMWSQFAGALVWGVYAIWPLTQTE